MANTRNIIDKNLFDPERGTTRNKEEAQQRDNAARQRIRSMVLMGTAILGNSKFAILQDPSAVRPGAPNTKVPQPAAQGQMRLKLGDSFEGFRVSEIRDKSVVFTKGPIREEISIDFFRPGDPQPQQATAPAAPAQQQPRPGLAPRVGARVVPPGGGQTAAPGGQTQAQQGGETAVERARRALRERQLQPPQQPSGRPAEGAAPAANP